MKTRTENIIYNFRVLLAAIICILGVSIFFINSGTLCNLLATGLNLKVSPSFTGGEIASDFFDDSEDDFGSGNLRYPSNTEFAEGSLDLVRYTVHQPVYDAKWQSNADYWQLSMDFRNGPANVRNIMIYIALPESENEKLEPLEASTETLFTPAENIEFNGEKPWNFAVWICGNEGKVFDANKNQICTTEISYKNDLKTVRIRIPLEDKNLQRIYTAKESYHYVLVGAYSPFDLGGFMPIEKRRSNSRGGTKSSKEFNSLIPKIYDILGDNQQLASWDAEELIKATISPVTANMISPKNNRNKKDETKEFINQVENRLSELSATRNSSEENTGEYFGFATLDEAINHFENILNQNLDDVSANAYYGSCLAMKGGQSSVVQAVNYVNKAFYFLDKAVELASTEEEMLTALMNRASVCKSVPESVFKKSYIGGQDYTKLASLQKNAVKTTAPEDLEYEKYVLAYLYINASQCYKSAGHENEALLMLQEAKKALE